MRLSERRIGTADAGMSRVAGRVGTAGTLFHLVRHADHGHVGKILTGRMPGVSLSPAGRAEAGALAHAMGGERLDAIFSSPQLRACETARAIGAETGCPVWVSPDLDEIDFGNWAGRSFEALAADPAWEHWNACRDDARTPAGETMADAARRLIGLVEYLRGNFPGDSICLVSHADVIKAALCSLRGSPFQQVHDFEIAPASVTTIAVGEDCCRVLAVNERPCRKVAEMVQ